MGDTRAGTNTTPMGIPTQSVGEWRGLSVAYVDLEDPLDNVDTNTDRTVKIGATTAAAMTTATTAIRQRQDPPNICKTSRA